MMCGALWLCCVYLSLLLDLNNIADFVLWFFALSGSLCVCVGWGVCKAAVLDSLVTLW